LDLKDVSDQIAKVLDYNKAKIEENLKLFANK
jgi:hypothetical protein